MPDSHFKPAIRTVAAPLLIVVLAVSVGGATAAKIKSAGSVIETPAIATPTESARVADLAALRVAKQRGDEATARALESRWGSVEATAVSEATTPIRILRSDALAQVIGGDRWGGDVCITCPYLAAGNSALAAHSDGTLFAAAVLPEWSLIRLYRSDDDGANWYAVLAVESALAITDPCLAVGEGNADVVILAFVVGSGTVSASVAIATLDLASGNASSLTLAPYPYAEFASPRLCVDSPECAYWYPYLVFHVTPIDGHRTYFTRSFDYGAHWEPITLINEPGYLKPADIDYGGTTLTVAYVSYVQHEDVFVRMSRDFGNSFESPRQVTDDAYEEGEVRVAATASGDTTLVVFAREYSVNDHDIDCVWTGDAGATWHGAFLPYSGADERYPAVVASPVTGRLHASYSREGEICYTWADPDAIGTWAASLVVSDRAADLAAASAIVVRSASCACHPDLNCDGVVDAMDEEPFALAMSDPAAYAQAYPNCDIDQADTDCDGDIDFDDFDRLLCLISGQEGCCPTPSVGAAIAWHDDSPPRPSTWFDNAPLQLPALTENLIICADDLVVPAERLANLRRSRGLPSAVVQVSDISPESPTAFAIDAWIEDFWNWNPRLRFVTLVGGVDGVPSFPLVYPDTGEPFYSDLRYGCRDASFPSTYLPLLAVGRLPSTSEAQLDSLIDKIQLFEAGYGGGNRVVFFGNQPEMSYVAARDSLVAASLGYAVTTLYSPTEAALMAALNDPTATLAFYYGHGSYAANWPLHVGNLDLLVDSGRPLLYVSGGCSFNDDHVAWPLGHALLDSPGGSTGSVGAAVAGGYGYSYEFAAGMLFGSRMKETLGEAVVTALQHHRATAAAAGQNVGYGSPTYWFTERMRLSGDPALRIDGDLTAVPAAVVRDAAYLAPNTPNPFNARTTISFDLPVAGRARLSVFGADGRRVAVLVDGPVAAGQTMVTWDGRDQRGRACASAVYFYRLDALGHSETGRMVMVK
jgi:hypothetical protein